MQRLHWARAISARSACPWASITFVLLANLCLSAALAGPPGPDGDPFLSAKTHVHRQVPPAAHEALTGDEPAFSIEIVYTAEVLGNMAGGVRRGAGYLDNLDLIAQADLGALLGWHGARAQIYGLYNNGVSFSSLVGDAQVISNIETGVRALRLYEAWLEQDLGSAASVKVGLYDLNSEFDVLDSAGVFLNSAYGIGTDIGLTGRNCPAIFPSTSLAACVQLSPAEGWIIRAALLDGVPNDPERPARTAVRLRRDDGALIVGEIEMPALGGKILLGHWRYTASFDRLDGSIGKGNAGTYVRAEVPLRQADLGGPAVTGFLRLGLADGRANAFDHFLSAGLSTVGLLRGRAADTAGLGFASAFPSAGTRMLTGTGQPETVLEVTYRAQLTQWLAVQPDLQYVMNPSADPALPDAVVLGLRMELSWGIER